MGFLNFCPYYNLMYCKVEFFIKKKILPKKIARGNKEKSYLFFYYSLEIQRDENAALKAALTSTLKAKEEDLKLYQQIMQQTREAFLQGLRQYKGEEALRGRAT